MSDTAFAYLYLNISSEMIYIIQNRLKAQNICHLRSSKVLDDILIEMFNEKFLDDTFQCDRLPNLQSLKQLIAKLVHCSIMKLNESSLDKLFDLIIMVFKYQLTACTHSTDLIQITLNHLYSLSEITNKQPIKLMISFARNRFLSGPAASHAFKIQFTRQTLLNYLIGMRIRVSVLLRIGVQCEDGRFRQMNTGKVACHCQLPGKITHFDTKGQVIFVQSFLTKGYYEFDPSMTLLGFNIYEREEELSEKFKNEQVNEDFDENNNSRTEIEQHPQSKLQFRKEAQLLAVILGQELKDNVDRKLENQSKIDLNTNLIKKKDSRFWLNIDLELEENENAIDLNDSKEEDQSKSEVNNCDDELELDNLEKAFEKLNNEENHNHKVNLLKIKQQMMDTQSDSNSTEPSLLELLDAEC